MNCLHLTILIPVILAAGSGSVQGRDVLEPSELVYIGAFSLPVTEGDCGWDWGGDGMAYHPDGDPEGPDDGFPGSIFATGHDWYQMVSEISIPVPVISSDPDELNRAVTLQDFVDVRGSLFPEMEMPRAGLAVAGSPDGSGEPVLYFCWGQHMQEGESGPAHGWVSTDLSREPAGLWSVGGLPNYLTCDYMTPVPALWSRRVPGGDRIATGRFRDGGQGACGPSLFVFDPAGMSDRAGSELETAVLLRYGDYTAPDSMKLPAYHHSDQWSGCAWATSAAGDAVIFAGTKGTGECWYGFENGVVWPEEPPYPPVPDYPFEQRGWWSSGFAAVLLFYDPMALQLVAEGEMEPWEPEPCCQLCVDGLLYRQDGGGGAIQRLGACCFDSAGGLLYVLEPRADGDRPVVHVWRVRG
ncbi:MAG: hypothetical protein JXA64_01690 [Candidatus Fermentibacteraceae bacterium]|nr:hypothetical protein [Candidatus Fermentibacteraceae bacterium]MBN2607798.1 hypothetical protein [Candidatus Fermentibacteraceae bacterium]